MSSGFLRIHLVSACVLIASCGHAAGQLEPRYVAVHNTMTAMGLFQTGPISEGSLGQGQSAVVPMRLRGGVCYTVLALGSDSVADIDVVVTDESGAEYGRDGSRDRTAATQVCLPTDGEYRLTVAIASGNGGYTLSTWAGGARGATGPTPGPGPGPGPGPIAGGQGTCASPLPLALNQPVRGTTQNAGQSERASCASGNAPEQVYLLRITQRAQVSVSTTTTYDGTVYIRSACANQQAELVCNDDNPDTTHSRVDVTLDPGDYFVFVDGYNDEAGDYELVASTTAVPNPAQVCANATALVPGQAATGTTQGGSDSFQSTCAGGAPSPDRVYTLDVPQRSRLRVRQTSTHDGAIHLRRDCADPQTELACNDDYGDQQHSMMTATLDPGRYFVITDGYGQGAAGTYTLQADLVPENGASVAGDTCASPSIGQMGAVTPVDTFGARDDSGGSCGGQGAPDVVYRVDVPARSRLRATFSNPEFGAVLYLQRTCGQTSTELACLNVAAASQGQGPATLDATVQPGSYFLVVDGAQPDQFGVGQLQVQLENLQQLAQVCQRATTLRPGRGVTGRTVGNSDQFQASCAGGALSPDALYTFRLTRRGHVRLEVAADYDVALHLRRDCADPGTELACNDDGSDNRHSQIDADLEPGTYFVVVDGFRTGNEGSYTLTLNVN